MSILQSLQTLRDESLLNSVDAAQYTGQKLYKFISGREVPFEAFGALGKRIQSDGVFATTLNLIGETAHGAVRSVPVIGIIDGVNNNNPEQVGASVVGIVAGSRLTAGANTAGQTGARSLSLKEMERQGAAAESMYDDIRASTTDVQNIAANTGLKDFQVARVKNHLFYDDTHQLSTRVGRFDPDYEIGQAWQRMETGQHLSQDIQLFKHEYFESRFEKIFRTDYDTAHNKTQLRYPSPLD